MASGGEVRSNQSQPTPNALHSDSRRVRYAEKAVALDPLCPRYQSLLGETLAAADRTEDALRLLHSNIEVDPDSRSIFLTRDRPSPMNVSCWYWALLPLLEV